MANTISLNCNGYAPCPSQFKQSKAMQDLRKQFFLERKNQRIFSYKGLPLIQRSRQGWRYTTMS
jgi:hypothetical protein